MILLMLGQTICKQTAIQLKKTTQLKTGIQFVTGAEAERKQYFDSFQLISV